MDLIGPALAVGALVLGGILKGAIGAGTPIVVVPVVALLYDVPLAVTLMTMPNLVSNLWQGLRFRHEGLPARFTRSFALAGALGAVAGSFLLAWLPGDLLLASLAAIVFVYIGLRLARPGWVLGRETATRLAGPVGLLGGLMQGAGGLSAPVSVTFLNAMRLERGAFIATISVFFAGMSVVQIPTLFALGILTPERLALSCAAVLPLFGAMPLGSWLVRHVSAAWFDRIVLGLLAVIAVRLLYGALA